MEILHRKILDLAMEKLWSPIEVPVFMGLIESKERGDVAQMGDSIQIGMLVFRMNDRASAKTMCDYLCDYFSKKEESVDVKCED